MIKRQYVEAELARWADVPRHELPRHYRKSKSQRDAAVGFLLLAPHVRPIYDADDNLTGFNGLEDMA